MQPLMFVKDRYLLQGPFIWQIGTQVILFIIGCAVMYKND
jgi:hypothetical protein